MTRGAVISSCTRYRYRLWRKWDANKPTLVFVMLNPSTANAEKDDPTIRKCIGFAERLGYGAIEVVNLFAWRVTDPKALRHAKRDGEILGLENDRYIARAANMPGTVVLAWGGNGDYFLARVKEVYDLVRQLAQPMCLGRTGSGQPRHPLMLSYATALEEYVG